MKPFDYISILLSIVVSLAMTHVLVGVSDMIKNGVSRYSLPRGHLAPASLRVFRGRTPHRPDDER